jgi:hypothetical protein
VKRRTLFLLALSVSFAAGLLVGKSTYLARLATVDASQATDPAFRDGMFQAKLDFQDGKRPHAAVGRWNTESARTQFVAGYQQAYREFSEAASGKSSMWPSVAEIASAGYRDGMIDGRWHRAASQPFHADQTTNYRAAGMAYQESRADREEYRRYYREGYVSGYQQAYYAQSKTENGKVNH